MKTIKELYNEGRLSARAYNAVRRNVSRYFIRVMSDYSIATNVGNEFVDHITIERLFEIFGEEHMIKWKGVGKGVMEELKGLL